MDTELPRLLNYVASLRMPRTAAASLLRAALAKIDPEEDAAELARVAYWRARLEDLGHFVVGDYWIRPVAAAVITGRTELALRVERCRGSGPPYRKEADGAVYYSLFDVVSTL